MNYIKLTLKLLLFIVTSFLLTSCYMTRINRGEELSKEQSYIKSLNLSDTINNDNQLMSKRKSYSIAKREMFIHFGYLDVIFYRKLSVIFNDDNIILFSQFKQSKYRKGVSLYLIYNRRERQFIEYQPKDW